MQSLTMRDPLRLQNEDSILNSASQAGLKAWMDWRETCSFLKHEKDELAGRRFAEIDDMHEGSD